MGSINYKNFQKFCFENGCTGKEGAGRERLEGSAPNQISSMAPSTVSREWRRCPTVITKHLLPVGETFVSVDTHLSVVIPDRSIIGTVTARHTRVLAGVWVWIRAGARCLWSTVGPHLITVTTICTHRMNTSRFLQIGSSAMQFCCSKFNFSTHDFVAARVGRITFVSLCRPLYTSVYARRRPSTRAYTDMKHAKKRARSHQNRTVLDFERVYVRRTSTSDHAVLINGQIKRVDARRRIDARRATYVDARRRT